MRDPKLAHILVSIYKQLGFALVVYILRLITFLRGLTLYL